jgi:hypothetical protein
MSLIFPRGYNSIIRVSSVISIKSITHTILGYLIVNITILIAISIEYLYKGYSI